MATVTVVVTATVVVTVTVAVEIGPSASNVDEDAVESGDDASTAESVPDERTDAVESGLWSRACQSS